MLAPAHAGAPEDRAIERIGAREVPVTALDHPLVLPAVQNVLALVHLRAPPDFSVLFDPRGLEK
jgi:hypothetical protein